MSSSGLDVVRADNTAYAEELIRRHAFDVILTNIASGTSAGVPLDVLTTVARLAPQTPIGVMMEPASSVDPEVTGLAFVFTRSTSPAALLAYVNKWIGEAHGWTPEATSIRRYFTCLERNALDQL